MAADVRGNPRTVILNRDLKRQMHLFAGAGHRQPQAMAIGRREQDFAGRSLAGLNRILDQIQHDLHELVAVPEHRRQRGVVAFFENDAGGEAGLGDAPRVIEDEVNVDRVMGRLTGVREALHAVDQAADSVRFVANEAGEFLILS